MKKRKNLLSGHVGLKIVFLAIPIILASLLQTVYNLTDTFWVGRLGADAVAAVSISFPIIFLLMNFIMGLTSAAMVFVAQSFGKGDSEKVNYYSTQSFFWMILFAIIMATFGAIFSGTLIRIFSPTDAVFSQAVDYLRISFYGIVFVFMYLIFMMLLRGIGEVKFPLYIVVGSVLLNFVLDPLFIYGLGPIKPSGVSGVAWATMFTQGIAGLVGLFVLIKGSHGIRIVKKYLGFDFKALKEILKLGLPTAIESSLHSIGMIFFTFIVSFFGTIAIASFGVGSKLLMLIMIPAFGFSMAVTTFIGQNIGANKMDRAVKGSRFGLLWGFVGLFLVGIVSFIFAEYFIRFFIPSDPEVISMATNFARIISFGFGFIALHVISAGIYKASGRTGISLLFGITQVTLLILLSTSAYLLGYGIKGLWISYLLSFLISGVIAFIGYLTGKWKRERIV